MQITYDELLRRVEAGERIFANAGEITQRCVSCNQVQYAQHYFEVSLDGRRHYICAACVE